MEDLVAVSDFNEFAGSNAGSNAVSDPKEDFRLKRHWIRLELDVARRRCVWWAAQGSNLCPLPCEVAVCSNPRALDHAATG